MVHLQKTMTMRMPNIGYVTLILGPMFSGKTTELLRQHNRHKMGKKKCILVKYAGDTRYDKECLVTHDRRRGEGETVKANTLQEVEGTIFRDDIQVVSIDEGQFFPDLADTCSRLADQGKIVYVAALNGNFMRKPFPQISLVLPVADDVHLLRAVCGCGADAIFTHRSTTDKKVVVIGGEEVYKAVCRECFEKANMARDSHNENIEEIPAKRMRAGHEDTVHIQV